MTQIFSQLEHDSAFVERHISPTPAQQFHMLETIDADLLSALIRQIVPANIQLPNSLAVGDALPSIMHCRRSSRLPAATNATRAMLQGLYRYEVHRSVHMPLVILRNQLENTGLVHPAPIRLISLKSRKGGLEALLNTGAAVLSTFRVMWQVIRCCVWRCRRVSNTSAAKKLTPTSAHFKYCWQYRLFYAVYHGPQGFKRIA